ncbi:MAG: HupE/UreJ family protein [Rhodoferax sp.]|nr:MAG: HupE/UreJ family protein [Rhodoferax sp.]
MAWRMMLRCWALALLWACAGMAHSHESLPASLLLQERAQGVFDMQWRLPATQGGALALEPVFPQDCQLLGEPVLHAAPGARLRMGALRCENGLRNGALVRFEGLPMTLVDVLVRVDYADGTQSTAIAHPRDPQVVLGARGAEAPAVSEFLLLGVEHILSGIDHLLFVLCLVLLVPTWQRLVPTITAFTLAHSLTLGLATLGWVHVPGAPVEACIALSILFLARELVLRRRGQEGATTRYPWAVAFVFGLLHGFGFAGALSEVGLPQGDIPAALLLFNLGVEFGQLCFVAMVLVLMRVARQLLQARAPAWQGHAVMGMGAWAGFWWLQRMGAVLAG